MKTPFLKMVALVATGLLSCRAAAQVNSGSDGHDGVLNPTSDLVIDMADHPDGIYQYSSVNIPVGVKVSFIPNAANAPVVWLVQGDCSISGWVEANGKSGNGVNGAAGGPGGFRGGNGPTGPGVILPQAGAGPGGGRVSTAIDFAGGNASHGTTGQVNPEQYPAGDTYGNGFLLPLFGGSGGSGSPRNHPIGGGGGGGAILIACSGQLTITGMVEANGGGSDLTGSGGGGSGGAIRLVATSVTGNGSLRTIGGFTNFPALVHNSAGDGRIRIDAFSDTLIGGQIVGVVSRGIQPIILLPANQAATLRIESLAGVAIAANPTGKLTTPDVIVPANQQNPISMVVRCTKIPLHSEVIIEVKPANGAVVRASALNAAGTQESSTATIQLNMPRGGGTILAKTISGIVIAAANGKADKTVAETGWTIDGERFARMEITASLSNDVVRAYVTNSGKRYVVPSR